MDNFQSEYFLDSLVDPKIVGNQLASSVDPLSSDVRKYSDTQTTWHRLFDATCVDFCQVYLKNILLGVKTVTPYSISTLPTSFCYIEQVDYEVVLSREVRLGVSPVSQCTLRKMFHSLLLLCHASDFTRERLKRNNHLNWLFPNGVPVVDIGNYLNTKIQEWWRQGFVHVSTVKQLQKWFLTLTHVIVKPLSYTFYDSLWRCCQLWKATRPYESDSWRYGENYPSAVVSISTKFSGMACQGWCKEQFLHKFFLSKTTKKEKNNRQMFQIILFLNSSKRICSIAHELHSHTQKPNMRKIINCQGESYHKNIMHSTRAHGLKQLIPFLLMQHNLKVQRPRKTQQRKYSSQKVYDLFLESICVRGPWDEFVRTKRKQVKLPNLHALPLIRSTHHQYSDLLTSLYNVEKAKIRWNANAAREVLNALGNPQAHLGFVCVCGLAGKTFIASQLSSRLASSRVNVGMSTSPHMVTLRERISVNGRWIRSYDLIVLFSKICSIVNILKISMISFHEIIFIMACMYYQQKKCSLAIIEIENLADNTPHPLTYVDVPLVYCGVIATVECSSHYLTTRKHLARLEKLLDTYLSLPFMAHTKVVCGPYVTKAIQMISVYVPGFLKNLRAPSELIFLRFKSQEMYLQENERIIQTTLKQLRSLDLPTRQKVKKQIPICRFQILHHRTQQLAARHIHCYLQCLYNACRILHYFWRVLAIKHPELFVHVFYITPSQSVQIFPGQCDHFCKLLTQLYRPLYNDRKTLLLQASFASQKFTPFLSSAQRERGDDSLFFSSKEFHYWKGIIKTVICETKEVNLKEMGKAWSNPLCVKGALHFLKYCSDSVEDWPNHYTKRLPFDNKIDLFRDQTKSASVQKIQSLKQKQKRLIQCLKKLNKRKEKALSFYSFDRFSAYHNEKLYWSFQQVAELREKNSKSLRSSEECSKENSNQRLVEKRKRTIVCSESYKNQDIPSQIQRKEFLIKNEIQYLDQCISELQQLPNVFPTPLMTLIDCPPNETSFERCFLDFRQQFSGSSVRLCVILTRDQPLSSLNSLYSILNDASYDSVVPNCTIKGLHLLQASHHNGKTLEECLKEVRTCRELNEKVSQMLLQTLKDQIEYQLCLSPPVSPLPVEILKLLITQQMNWAPASHNVKTSTTHSRIQEIKKKIHKELSHIYGKQNISDDEINNYIFYCLKCHPLYTKTMSLITKHIPACTTGIPSETTVKDSAARLHEATCSGHLRVLRRMHRLCETLKTSQRNDLSSIMKKRHCCIHYEGYLNYTIKKPLNLLHSTMSWKSLWSLVALHPSQKFYMKACRQRVLKNCGQEFGGLSQFLTLLTERNNKKQQHACRLISFYTLPVKSSLIFSILKKWKETCQLFQKGNVNSNDSLITNRAKPVKWCVSPDICFLIHQQIKPPFQVCMAEFYQESQSKQLFINMTCTNKLRMSCQEDNDRSPIFKHVSIPIETYCHAITKYVWYQAYKFSKRKRACKMVQYSMKKRNPGKASFCFNSYPPKRLHQCRQRCSGMLAFNRIHFVWSDIYGIIMLIMSTIYHLSKYACAFETTSLSKKPLWLPRITFEKKKNYRNPCYEEYFLNLVKDLVQKTSFKNISNISDARLKHFIDNKEGCSKMTLNLFQKGDLPLQLSIAFQKAAIERSILLICSHSSLCSEVLETLGMTLILKKKDVPCEYVSYVHHKNTVFKETLLPSFPCWYDSKLASHYFSKGFVTLSAASLLGNEPNAYLKHVHIKRKRNELKRYRDLNHYSQVKYKDI